MPVFSLDNISISALAAAVPATRLHNRDYAHISPSERNLLMKTTGVQERRIAPPGLTTSDLCQAAAESILENKRLQPGDIQLLVFVSQSGDYYLPATAAILQHKLGLSPNTIAFDVGLGCSGYVYGLAIAASLMKSCGLSKALLLAGDISSTTLNPKDKSTWPLFGDAGTATLLEQNVQSNPWLFNLMTDGSGAESIIIPDGGTRNRLSEQSFQEEDISEGITRHRLNLILKGPEIFSFAIREVPDSIHTLLKHFNKNLNTIDYFVMHQANLLMNETIRKKLKLPSEKTPYTLPEFGNTSSASIPLTLVTRLQQELHTKPLSLLLSGFGVGLSWGNVMLNTQSVDCFPLLEL